MCRRTGRPKVRVLQDSLEGIQETPNDARKDRKNQRESSGVIDFSLELTFKKMSEKRMETMMLRFMQSCYPHGANVQGKVKYYYSLVASPPASQRKIFTTGSTRSIWICVGDVLVD